MLKRTLHSGYRENTEKTLKVFHGPGKNSESHCSCTQDSEFFTPKENNNIVYTLQ